MRNILKMLCVLLCAVLLCPLAGCGDKHKEAYVYFELKETPSTLDAQTASTDTELLIVRNIYEGLMRRDGDGNIVCGAAESYEQNGLTYTFHLREDAKWSTGDSLTADDFVFGLRRAVSPETAAPFVSRLYSISGAEQINRGSADVSALGVSAPDGHTVTVTLCREDADFLETLASSVAMPCNEEFFYDCIGKYGLESKYIISNGSYSIRKWAKNENFGIRLYSNKHYTGDFEPQNAAVYLSCREDEERVTLLSDSTVDLAFLDSTELSDAEAAGLKISQINNICWVMTVSEDYGSEVRKAFAKLVSPEVYGGSLHEGFTAADSIYPSIISEAQAAAGAGVTAYDLEGAKQIFSAAVKKMENKRFPSATFYYYDDPAIKDAVTAVAGHWQQNLSAFINIEAVSDLTKLTRELSGPQLSFAVFPVSAANGSASEYLLKFGVDSSDAIASQTKLLSSNTVIPFAYESSNIAAAKTIETVIVSQDNGYVDFSFIIKKG